jgi:hypothetical protein
MHPTLTFRRARAWENCLESEGVGWLKGFVILKGAQYLKVTARRVTLTRLTEEISIKVDGRNEGWLSPQDACFPQPEG